MTRTCSGPGIVATLFIATLASWGCQQGKGVTGPLIANYAALKPDNLTLEKCVLKLAGSKYAAEIHQTRSGDDIELELVAMGTVFETERYRSTDTQFSVVDTGGERYDPPIPLIKYPMHVGDTWTWAGKYWTGPEPHTAQAKVTTSTDDVVIEGGTARNVVRVEIVRTVDSGSPDVTATRKLVFWIVPNMGVVKRAFGDESSREPLEK